MSSFSERINSWQYISYCLSWPLPSSHRKKCMGSCKKMLLVAKMFYGKFRGFYSVVLPKGFTGLKQIFSRASIPILQFSHSYSCWSITHSFYQEKEFIQERTNPSCFPTFLFLIGKVMAIFHSNSNPRKHADETALMPIGSVTCLAWGGNYFVIIWLWMMFYERYLYFGLSCRWRTHVISCY